MKLPLSRSLIENWLFGSAVASCGECAASCDEDAVDGSFGTDFSSPGWSACKSACSMLVSALFENHLGTWSICLKSCTSAMTFEHDACVGEGWLAPLDQVQQ